MHDSAKYLIHADITASGVVERSDVVGAVFGQTEGLLGDDLDLRDLQESQKLGRIDVEIDSEGGQSFGQITIASGLDRVETAILAAALESIERVGPCRADIVVGELEDVRSAKRREIVDRATELLAEYDESALSSQDIVEEVREAVRVEDITDFHGFPAGPRVGESDAVIVVEGRSDVLTLLKYGIKNAIAVEGTDVPEEVARLTSERTVTAFLDGDRGGDLILKELAQVGDIDHVALAPPGRSVEDLSRGEVMDALRGKVPFEAVDSDSDAGTLAATDGSTRPAPTESTSPAEALQRGADEPGITAETDDSNAQSATSADTTGGSQSPGTEDPARSAAETSTDERETAAEPETESVPEPVPGVDTETDAETDSGADALPEQGTDESDASDESTEEPPSDARAAHEDTESEEEQAGAGDEPVQTLAGHVQAVIGDGSGLVRALDDEFGVIREESADKAFDLLEEMEIVPEIVVIDGELSQRILDVAAQRGVDRIVCEREGEFVKQPTAVRIQTAAEMP